jgi:hypothetical protein
LERAAADSQVAVAARAASLAQAAYERGETSGLEPALAALAVARTERLRNAASTRLTGAGQALIAAAGNAASLSAERWPDPREDPLMEDAQR